MSILITGGAGYIGTHACIAFLEAGQEIIVLDNLSNSNPSSIERVQKITGRNLVFEEADSRDRTAVEAILRKYDCHCVVHFAGLKAVGESVAVPLEYYENNVVGTLNVLEAMQNCNVKNFIFSSSATVYGTPVYLPLDENHPINPVNPYGRTKAIVESMLIDLANSDPDWHIAILRYFNPVGAHISGLIGESPRGVPNNLMPFVGDVARGLRDRLQIFGNDYNTHDGTGIRDYIHVSDLAVAHVSAYNVLSDFRSLIVNLGTGYGYSVLEMVKAFEDETGKHIPLEFSPRREGDVAECYAKTLKAHSLLGWNAERGLKEIMRDTWKWINNNP